MVFDDTHTHTHTYTDGTHHFFFRLAPPRVQ